ncbi:UDP-glucose 4-epimerase family protein [Solimicrobium silvestre]|uniref:Nucleoside-diphosphate-sugar epimerase n=1 Tax=Solimicrobium silvestre TaxID=2099400 RepID=A0A2S9GYA9_9BURK|nr:SDR family oxidoreductase [Solimicrobium silvestre]PRC92712.1 Nucleoside-diphosphate-sugar epimerase [Solimicrobium silvestre]
MNKHILLTGASGFVGGPLAQHLIAQGAQMTCVVRTPFQLSGAQMVTVDGIDDSTDWTASLKGIDTVIHCAARVHIMNDTSPDPLADFRRINVAGTLNLARQALAAGVNRFIYLSSIKVNGEHTDLGKAFNELDKPDPQDSYGVSKFEAEQALLELSSITGLEVVIIRPPLVYGPGVKANFLNMLKLVRSGIPLPFGAINNKRSFVYVENLISLITLCIDHPNAANQVFLVSDGCDLSTTELLRQFAGGLGVKQWLLPVPESWLTIAAMLLGKKAVAQRLCGSLQVDTSKARQLLGWEPPMSVEQGMKLTAKSLN